MRDRHRPPRYARNQLMAIAVPIDEIEKPIIELRNQTLFYSIAFSSLRCLSV